MNVLFVESYTQWNRTFEGNVIISNSKYGVVQQI